MHALPPSQIDAFRRQVTIDWGLFLEHFSVSNAQIKREAAPDSVGRIREYKYLTFEVVAKVNIIVDAFFFRFYDASGREVEAFTPIEFDPSNPGYGWRPGMRASARVLLPADMSNMALIKFSEF